MLTHVGRHIHYNSSAQNISKYHFHPLYVEMVHFTLVNHIAVNKYV